MARNVLRSVPTLHRRLAELLVRSCKGRGSRHQARDELVADLTAHVQASHEVLHTFAVRHSPELAEPLATLRRCDERLLDLASQAADSDVESDDFLHSVTALREALDEHARAEQELLERGMQDVEAPKLRELGASHERTLAMHRRKLSPRGASPRRRYSGSRADLYERARRAGVPGRSAMSRDELIAALQGQGHAR